MLYPSSQLTVSPRIVEYIVKIEGIWLKDPACSYNTPGVLAWQDRYKSLRVARTCTKRLDAWSKK